MARLNVEQRVSVVGVWPLTLERGADFQLPPFTYYSTWTGVVATSTPFNFTGMSADCMFRISPNDTSTILTLTPSLGGAAGTYTLPLITAANIETLWAATVGAKCWWDCRFTNAGSPVKFVEPSEVKLKQGVTR